MIFLVEKNRDFEPKGVDLYPPRGFTMGRGRECNDSRDHSGKYSRELWEVTSLKMIEKSNNFKLDNFNLRVAISSQRFKWSGPRPGT